MAHMRHGHGHRNRQRRDQQRTPAHRWRTCALRPPSARKSDSIDGRGERDANEERCNNIVHSRGSAPRGGAKEIVEAPQPEERSRRHRRSTPPPEHARFAGTNFESPQHARHGLPPMALSLPSPPVDQNWSPPLRGAHACRSRSSPASLAGRGRRETLASCLLRAALRQLQTRRTAPCRRRRHRHRRRQPFSSRCCGAATPSSRASATARGCRRLYAQYAPHQRCPLLAACCSTAALRRPQPRAAPRVFDAPNATRQRDADDGDQGQLHHLYLRQGAPTVRVDGAGDPSLAVPRRGERLDGDGDARHARNCSSNNSTAALIRTVRANASVGAEVRAAPRGCARWHDRRSSTPTATTRAARADAGAVDAAIGDLDGGDALAPVAVMPPRRAGRGEHGARALAAPDGAACAAGDAWLRGRRRLLRATTPPRRAATARLAPYGWRSVDDAASWAAATRCLRLCAGCPTPPRASHPGAGIAVVRSCPRTSIAVLASAAASPSRPARCGGARLGGRRANRLHASQPVVGRDRVATRRVERALRRHHGPGRLRDWRPGRVVVEGLGRVVSRARGVARCGGGVPQPLRQVRALPPCLRLSQACGLLLVLRVPRHARLARRVLVGRAQSVHRRVVRRAAAARPCIRVGGGGAPQQPGYCGVSEEWRPRGRRRRGAPACEINDAGSWSFHSLGGELPAGGGRAGAAPPPRASNGARRARAAAT